MHTPEPPPCPDPFAAPVPQTLPVFTESPALAGHLTLNIAHGPAHGSPLLLLHGVTRCWRDWAAVLPELTPHWQVTAPDHRGHGFSERSPTASYRIVDYAADAGLLLAQMGDQPVVLFGHSLGAMVAAVVAARAPGRIRALVLEDPPGSILAEGVRQSPFFLQFSGIQRLLTRAWTAPELAAALADLPVHRPGDDAIVRFGELRDPAALRFSAECLIQMDPRVLDPLLAGRWLEGLDWFAELPRIDCPTLLLRADPACGGMLSAAEADRATALIPRCQRLDLPGIGHNIHSTQPRRTLEIVNQFLASL